MNTCPVLKVKKSEVATTTRVATKRTEALKVLKKDDGATVMCPLMTDEELPAGAGRPGGHLG